MHQQFLIDLHYEIMGKVGCVGATRHLSTNGGLFVWHHGEIDDPIILRSGSPIDREISEATRERSPGPESVCDYS